MEWSAYYHANLREASMQLEKLSVLEQSLNRLIDQYTRLKEEKSVLERGLREANGRVAELEDEGDALRQERDAIRERLGRMVEMIERLETLESGESGTPE